jgi:hypothetical protein
MSRVALVTLIALASAAAPASAATLTPLKPCYASTGKATDQLEDIVVQGADFAPQATVEVLIDGVPMASAPTDAIGAFKVLVDAPFQRSGERAFTVVAQDGFNNVSSVARVTDLDVTLTPKRAAPSRRVRFCGRGFMQPAPVYAHYLIGGKEQTTVRLARRSSGPCGTFSVKRRQIPVDDPRTGRWIVQFDQKRTYSPVPDPVWVRLPIDVVEVFLEP